MGKTRINHPVIFTLFQNSPSDTETWKTFLLFQKNAIAHCMMDSLWSGVQRGLFSER
jgi:hypothetical protein